MMTPVLALPLTISLDASTRLNELGIQREADLLIGQAMTLPGVRSILQLSLVPSFEMDDIPWLVIEML
jgi:hypothetical protein